MIAVDLFAGCGGVSLGLAQAGFEVVAACDNDSTAAMSYQANHPATKMVVGDIVAPDTLYQLAAIVDGRQVDVVTVCAPCQPFSARNASRGDDPREQLILQAMRVVERLKPSAVVFENVPGFMTAAFSPVMDTLRFELLRLGFVFKGPVIHDASDYGVPQRRKRCIIIAARDEEVLAAFESGLVRKQKKTVRDAIGDLEPLQSGDAHPTDRLHVARKHRAVALQRFVHIPHDGGSRSSLPPHLVVDCHKRAGNAFPDAYGRLAWDAPAVTLTTGCNDATRGRYLHPVQDRALTCREAARLQGFPDDYEIFGNSSEIAKQIGNAVPPPMMQVIALALKAALSSYRARKPAPVARPIAVLSLSANLKELKTARLVDAVGYEFQSFDGAAFLSCRRDGPLVSAGEARTPFKECTTAPCVDIGPTATLGLGGRWPRDGSVQILLRHSQEQRKGSNRDIPLGQGFVSLGYEHGWLVDPFDRYHSRSGAGRRLTNRSYPPSGTKLGPALAPQQPNCRRSGAPSGGACRKRSRSDGEESGAWSPRLPILGRAADAGSLGRSDCGRSRRSLTRPAEQSIRRLADSRPGPWSPRTRRTQARPIPCHCRTACSHRTVLPCPALAS